MILEDTFHQLETVLSIQVDWVYLGQRWKSWFVFSPQEHLCIKISSSAADPGFPYFRRAAFSFCDSADTKLEVEVY